MEHLFTNAQAALTAHGEGFVSSVNFLHSIPMLGLVEILTLGLPFAIHIIWGVLYALRAKFNSRKGNGAKPSLGHFGKNKAFTWQRISALLLVIGILLHVYDMRFSRYPVTSDLTRSNYVVRIHEGDIPKEEQSLYGIKKLDSAYLVGHVKSAFGETSWESILQNDPQKENEIFVETPEFGAAVLLNVKDVFRSPWMLFIYTVFVLLATFHAFNGLWTLLVTWGIITKSKGLYWARVFTVILMLLFSVLGLCAVWGN